MPYSLKPDHTPPSAPASRLAVVGIVVATLLCLVGAVLGLAVAAVSPMLFDAPQAQSNPFVGVAFLMTASFWAVCLITPVLAWIFWKRRRRRIAWACMAVPPAWGVAALAMIQAGLG